MRISSIDDQEKEVKVPDVSMIDLDADHDYFKLVEEDEIATF